MQRSFASPPQNAHEESAGAISVLLDEGAASALMFGLESDEATCSIQDYSR